MFGFWIQNKNEFHLAHWALRWDHFIRIKWKKLRKKNCHLNIGIAFRFNLTNALANFNLFRWICNLEVIFVHSIWQNKHTNICQVICDFQYTRYTYHNEFGCVLIQSEFHWIPFSAVSISTMNSLNFCSNYPFSETFGYFFGPNNKHFHYWKLKAYQDSNMAIFCGMDIIPWLRIQLKWFSYPCIWSILFLSHHMQTIQARIIIWTKYLRIFL